MQIGSIHRCDEPSIVFLKGRSIVELDFKARSFSKSTAFFLKKGQYFKLIEGVPEIFPLDETIDIDHYRYLFSHLTGIGHILVDGAGTFEPDLEEALGRWQSMNPFRATEDELQLLFDTNDFIERNLDPNLPVSEISSYRQLNEIAAQRIDHSLHQWKTHKLIVQAKYLLFFAGKSVQQVAYDLRFKDPSYFGRFFKRVTHQTPGQFLLENDDSPSKMALLNDLKALIDKHFASSHSIHFYAEKLNSSSKVLAEKVRSNYGVSIKDLIGNRLIQEADHMLQEKSKVSEIAFRLGFKEVSHFSSFYRSRTGLAPSKSTIQ